MSRWQRLLRLALGVFAVGFAGVMWFAIRERAPAPGQRPAPRTDPAAVAESTGGATLLAKGAKQDFRVEYARALTYADGTLRFERVTVHVPQRAGRDFTLTADAAEVTNSQAHVVVRGHVRLTASDGLVMTAGEGTFDNGDGVVRVPGPVDFSRGRMTGTSVGATFDRERDVIWLLDKVRITVKPDAHGAGDADITAGAAGFARRERYIRFERGVQVRRAKQQVESDGAVAYLAREQDTLQMVELRGNSRVRTTAPSPGGLDAMSARDINLNYAEDGQTLQRALLSGGGIVQMAAGAGQAGRRLSGEWVDLTLAPDGQTLVGLAARDNVELEMPADATTPARRVRSTSLEAAGPPDQGITSARFVDHVEFRETRPATRTAPAAERIARSQTLDTVVKGGFTSIDAATFNGGVTFTDNGMDASAPEATYDVTRGALHLVSGVAAAPPAARVNDARATIQARTIDLTLDGHGMVADADVRSLLKSQPGAGAPDHAAAPAAAAPSASAGRRGTGSTAKPPAAAPPAPHTAGSPTTTAHRPGMLDQGQPVNVTAAHLVYDSTTSRALYTGDARLWQGETAVQADSIAIDDASGNLTAKGKVRSTLRLASTENREKTPPAGSQPPAAPEMRTTVLTSEDLLYDDDLRRATYTTNARMVGSQGDLRGDRIELYLDESGHALERVEAYENVLLRSEARNSTGARLTYFAADERYVMSGAPVRVLEQLPDECRETTGKTLTFFRSTDSITVDGNDESRTQGKTSGGRCPEPRTD